jgi:predicted SAM-dependent methyltransferase
VDLSSESNLVRLNLGAGGTVIAGYLSVDIEGEPDIRADVRAIPLEPGTVDEIMAIHLFEHLPRWHAESTLQHWHALLKPGGRLVLELPDLLKCCENILAGREPRAGLWGLYGDPQYERETMSHRWGWTADELCEVARGAGFHRLRIKAPHFHKKYRDMRLEALA